MFLGYKVTKNVANCGGVKPLFRILEEVKTTTDLPLLC